MAPISSRRSERIEIQLAKCREWQQGCNRARWYQLISRIFSKDLPFCRALVILFSFCTRVGDLIRLVLSITVRAHTAPYKDRLADGLHSRPLACLCLPNLPFGKRTQEAVHSHYQITILLAVLNCGKGLLDYGPDPYDSRIG